MARKKVNDRVVEMRERIARWVLEGRTQTWIGRQLGISGVAVCKHVKRIREEWRARALVSIADRQAQEVVGLDQLEVTTHAAFVKSCLPPIKFQQKLNETDGDFFARKAREMREHREMLKEFLALPIDEMMMRPEARAGDARLLETLLRIRDRRIKLFGLDAPDKIQLSGDPDNPVKVMTFDELRKMPIEDRLKYIQDQIAGRN